MVTIAAGACVRRRRRREEVGGEEGWREVGEVIVSQWFFTTTGVQSMSLG